MTPAALAALGPAGIRAMVEAASANVRVSACPCGHPGCDQHLLSTQRSSGFDKADAELYVAAPAALTLAANLMERVVELEVALKSIAANTCCDGCREAALVAQAALKGAAK
jgi:hypothetical protein